MAFVKCWDCIHLAKCKELKEKGCKRFEKPKTQKELAKELGVKANTIYSWFVRHGVKETLEKIYEKTGVKYKVSREQGKVQFYKVGR